MYVQIYHTILIAPKTMTKVNTVHTYVFKIINGVTQLFSAYHGNDSSNCIKILKPRYSNDGNLNFCYKSYKNKTNHGWDHFFSILRLQSMHLDWKKFKLAIAFLATTSTFTLSWRPMWAIIYINFELKGLTMKQRCFNELTDFKVLNKSVKITRLSIFSRTSIIPMALDKSMEER